MGASIWNPALASIPTDTFLTPQMYQGVGDGVADDSAALIECIAEAVVQKKPVFIYGTFRYTEQIIVPLGVNLFGSGIPSFEIASTRSFSCLVKDFNGTGVLFSGDGAGSHGIQYDNTSGRTGDNVQVTGTRFRSESISVTNAGQDGLRIGTTATTGTGTSPINANLFYIGRLVAYNNGRYGCNVDDTNTGGSGNYPLGVPNANGGYIGLGECDRNDVDGIRFGNCIDNVISYLVCQSNTQRGFRFSEYSRGHVITKYYGELNGTEEGIFEVNTSQNIVYSASRAVTLSSGITNLGGNSNLLITHESGIGQDGAFNTCPWLWGPEFYTRNATPGGAAYLGAYVETGTGAWFKVEKDGTSGTRVTISTKRDGNTNTDKVQVDSAGRVFLFTPSSGVYFGNSTAFPAIFSGAGTPEGAVTAVVGSLFLRTDGGAGTSLYVKQTGTGNTGWVGK